MNYQKNLPESARQVDGALTWVTPDGNVWGMETRIINGTPHRRDGMYFKYATTVNGHNGYAYVPVKTIIDADRREYKIIQRRVHILIAQAFVENPHGYPIVGHRNNIKTDNRAQNLYWTTPKENTQKAVADGLMKNDAGYRDSQSKPVYMFDTYSNEKIGAYGSASDAERETGVCKGTILNQAKYKRPVRKPYYFRFQDDPTAEPPTIVERRDIATDEVIGRYWNVWEASRATGIHPNTIAAQCGLGRKPKWSKTGDYFRYSA